MHTNGRRDFRWWLAAGLAASALALVAYVAASPAKAADLGGNCCADIEERVAELEATTARKGNRKVTLVISGQVSKALLWHDIVGLEGADKLRTIDNTNSGTRLRISGEGKVSPHIKAGFLIELGMDETAGRGLGIARDDITIRHSAVWIETAIGRTTLGRTSMATDGIAELDLSNANLASLPMSLEPIWTYSGLPGVLGGIFNPVAFDGGRADIVRYDTPIMSGVQASASWGGGQAVGGFGDDTWDAALRWTGEAGGVRMALGGGYRVDRYTMIGGSDQRTLVGSASVMHVATGIFSTAAVGRQTDHPVWGDLQMWQARAGVERNFSGHGATTFFGEYGQHDLKTMAVDSTFWGAGVVQTFGAAGLDVFLSYRSYDIGGALDAQAGMAGVRVRF